MVGKTIANYQITAQQADDGARIANNQFLMYMLSPCLLHERFRLAD